MLRTSERRDFKRCPQKWWWGYRNGLVPIRTQNALWFGIGIHIALAHFYGPGFERRKDFVEKWEEYCDEDEGSRLLRYEGEEGEAKWTEARDLGIAMLTGYREHWGLDKHWDVVVTEMPFQIEIPSLDNPDETEGVFASTIDGVYWDKNDRRLKLMEHKTAKALTFDHLKQDDQGGSYWAIANVILRDKGILKPKQRIGEITYNFLRKALPDERPTDSEGFALNKDGSRSKQQPKPLFARESVLRTPEQCKIQIDRMSAELRVMNLMRDRTLPIYKNPTRDCSWDCSFKQMCELHDTGADWKDFRRIAFKVRDPYADHRKATE